ncbi:peptidase associated/transthyretin-like domain-containing protein [Chryseobacterium gambrini]|uniref:hypothetical protein n=1 Tax=Chryseobacterium gambrini TaxID=373672 RepID=UPI0022F18D1B|nr:hypothetical protein [Chryseobacterium gambrini]WBV50945.1 hypothetical protein PFY09_11435 [Chryseobacterium gambrini]
MLNNNIQKIIFLFFIFLLTNLYSQSTVIVGSVFFNSEPISHANILFLDDKSQIDSFIFSDNDGKFSLTTHFKGTGKIKITAFGFVTFEKELVINQENLNIGRISLKEAIKDIPEVIIKNKKPITLKKDTIEYKAASFANGTENNLEDLLKKLPGIDIDKDGKIKIGQKSIEKVLVENDDLFEKGYQILTQNMPSAPIEKIQVISKYSKNKLLKNIENSEAMVLNITLKDKSSNRWMGSYLLASTSYVEKLRQVKINLMSFSKKKKIYLLFNTNNIGINEMKGVEYFIKNSTENSVENIGNIENSTKIINLHVYNSLFEEKRTNFNNDYLGAFNYIKNYGSGYYLKIAGIYNKIGNENQINSVYNFDYDGLKFSNKEEKIWKLKQQNIVTKLELTKDFKNNSSVNFYNKLSWIDNNNDNNFIFNNEYNPQYGLNKIFSNENKLVYTKKIDSSTAIVGVGRFMLQDRPYSLTEKNNLVQKIFNHPASEFLQQDIDSKYSYSGFKISYIKSFEKHNIELPIGGENQIDKLLSKIRLLDNNKNEVWANKDLNFDNNLEIIKTNFFINPTYQYKAEKWKLKVSGNSSFLNVKSDNKNTFNDFLFSPTFTIRYENKSTGNFALEYIKTFSNTEITDIYNGYIYMGNRIFAKSNTDFNILPNYNINFDYQLGNVLKESMSFNINYLHNNDYMSSNFIVNSDYTFNQKIILKNNYYLNVNLELKKFINLINSRFSLINKLSKSSYENSVNDSRIQKTRSTNYTLGFELKSGWLKSINYELGYNWVFNYLTFTNNKRDYINQNGYFNLYYNLSSKLFIDSNIEYYLFGQSNQKHSTFVDLKASYKLIDSKMNIFIQGRNLLNTKYISGYSINNISESFYTQKLLPLSILIGFNKNF